MKKALILMLALALCLGLCACGTAAPETSPEPPAADPPEITITIPAEYLDDGLTQADCDAIAARSGYRSATLNGDGSVTYVMTRVQHAELLRSIEATVDSALDGMAGSEEYPHFISVLHNDTLSVFTVTTHGSELNFNESYSVLILYMYSSMYAAFAGTDNGNFRVDFINEATGRLYDSVDASSLSTAG